MSAPASEPSSALLDAYTRHPQRAGYDELVTDAGVREHARDLASAISGLGLPGLLAARAEVINQSGADGVSLDHRPWLIDPLPLPLAAADWSALETGLAQRARLLDAVLTDLYTTRSILHRGVVPPAAVLAHPGFARSADQTLRHGRPNLLLTGTNLGRDASGAWLALSDRTQAPAGAGFAMATRRIISKVMAGLHRGSDLARLRNFFLTSTGALLDAAGGAETPRVVLFSAGSASASAFDQGLLATMLGFALAEADDLVISGGRVLLRAGDELEPVDVILRRVDDPLADPLEFRGDSEIGIPGLVEAVRRGSVTVANPVGAAVLDNPALIAYLPSLCRELLGEDLLLPSPTTWWCGDPVQAGHALTHLDQLVIKPLSRDTAAPTYGWQLNAAERVVLADRIRQEPWAWCAQEPVTLSTAPVVTEVGLEPRRFVLRAFGVAAEGGYRFLPGGLGRVAASLTEQTVTGTSGALAKDVWVPAAVQATDAAGARSRVTLVRETAVPPRVARTLMTIGRLAERAEATARLIKVADDLAEDFGSHPGSAGAAAVDALLRAVSGITGTRPQPAETQLAYLTRLTLDPSEPGGVHHSVRRLTAAAEQVRDLMSVDVWSVFNRLERTLEPAGHEAGLQQLLADVLESLLAFAGILAQSMVRDSSWAFLDAGGRLERASHTVKLLRFALLDAAEERLLPSAELAAEAVLRAGESIITHRRRAAAGTGPSTGTSSVRQLLVHDPSNPRSVSYQLAELARDLRLVSDEPLAAQAEAILTELAAFRGGAGDSQVEQLAILGNGLDALAARLASRHFVRQARRRSADTPWTVS